MSNTQEKNGKERLDMKIKASDIIVYTPEGEKVNVELKARKTKKMQSYQSFMLVIIMEQIY